MNIKDENPEDEAVDDALLKIVLARQLKVSLLVSEIAKSLYEARRIWVASEMTWDELTPKQKADYLNEVESLITGQPAQMATVAGRVYPALVFNTSPQGDGADRDFDGEKEQ